MSEIYSVGQVNKHIKSMFSQDLMLRSISVKGEISNCTYHSSGHIYFTMKDETGTLSCIMFQSCAKSLKFRMKNGMKIVATGSIEVYERDGKYQLYARKIVQEGAGDLYARFEALKQELEEMGMFDAAYKKEIPQYATTIGIVTSPTGAAVQDIINIATRRNPYVQLILYPALVQGDGAAESIVKGIEVLELKGVDVIIVGRGGGSIEDLWAFNEEAVARAIFACSIPIVSAVGHETDFTIADFVADLRAPTPSAAAELTVFEYVEFAGRIADLQSKLAMQMLLNIRNQRNRCRQYLLRMQNSSPAARIREQKHYYVNLSDQFKQIMRELIMQDKHRLQMLTTSLEALSPLTRLQGGYVYASVNGTPLAKISQVKAEDEVRLQLADGVVTTKVTGVKKQ